MNSGYTTGGAYIVDGPLEAAKKRQQKYSKMDNKKLFKYDSDLVFPTIPNGPRCKYINSLPWCPNNFIELRKKSVMELMSSKSNIIIKLSEIIYSLKQKINQDGLNIYLLPWKPFSMIGEIEIDEKLRNNKDVFSKLKSKEEIISYVLLECFGQNIDTMSVLKKDDYLQCMTKWLRDGIHFPNPLNSTEQNEWTKRFHINAIDKTFHKLAVAQYNIATNVWYAKCFNIINTFQNYNPLFLGDDAAIEINLIMRLQASCSVFNYDYNIEKLNNPTNGYIRVPKSLRNKVIEIVELGNGRCSLNSLVRDIRQLYSFGNNYYGKIIWLLRHISHRKEDLCIDQQQVQLIFARNKNEDGSGTLSGDSLDFTETNLGKYFWRSLISLESYFKVDLTKYEEKTEIVRPISTFSKSLVVCFPHGCDLRHVDDISVMCPSRFTTKTQVMSHIRSHHGISRHEEEIIEKIIENNELINFVKNQSEEDWVEQNISNLEDKDIDKLLILFIKEILKKRQWRSSLRRCLQNLEETIETKTKILGSKINEVPGDKIRKEIQEQRKLVEIAGKFLDHYDSLLLPSERINFLLDKLFTELTRQKNILKDYVEMCREQKEIDEKANVYGKILTEDYSQLLSEAKINVATGKNYIQMVKENDAKNQDDNSIVVALAMITAIHEHNYVAADQILQSYQEKIDKAGIDCTLLHKLTDLSTKNKEQKRKDTGGTCSTKRSSRNNDDDVNCGKFISKSTCIEMTSESPSNFNDASHCLEIKGELPRNFTMGSTCIKTNVPYVRNDNTSNGSDSNKIMCEFKPKNMGSPCLEIKGEFPRNFNDASHCLEINDKLPRNFNDASHCLEIKDKFPRSFTMGSTCINTNVPCFKSDKNTSNDSDSDKVMCEFKPKKRSLDDDELTTYKKLKVYETHTNFPLTINQFQQFVKKEDTVGIDTRHMSIFDVSTFIGNNMLPGNDIVHVGKGFDKGTVTYELIDPTTIYINLADYKGLLFQFLYLLKYGDKNRITYQNKIQVVFLNILNTLFLLNDTGFSIFQEVISKAVASCFHYKYINSPVPYETKKKIWTIFVNSVNLLNSNRCGGLNGFFAVRLCRHGDFSGTAVKIITNESYVMPHGFQLPNVKICLEYILQNTSCSYPAIQYNNKTLFHEQSQLIDKLRQKYMIEIQNISMESKSFGLVDFQPNLSCKKKKLIFTSSDKTLPHTVSVEDLSNSVDKTGCHPMRSFESVPSHHMSEKDLNSYDTEINEWRQKECCICYEPFSTRPLEGLNCVYRKLENDFCVHYNISKKIIWVKNKDLLEKYIEFASNKIHEIDRPKNGVTANGMHMFHRDCIRRHIHLSALDISKKNITCPMCQTIIYDEFQKNVILANVNEMACRLMIEMESPSITTYSTDDLINIKHHAEIDNENGLLQYFGCHYVNAEIDQDKSVNDKLEEKSNMTYFKKELKEISKDSEKLKEYEEKLKMYLDLAVYKDTQEFSMKKAKNLVDYNLDGINLNEGFQCVFSVGCEVC